MDRSRRRQIFGAIPRETELYKSPNDSPNDSTPLYLLSTPSDFSSKFLRAMVKHCESGWACQLECDTMTHSTSIGYSAVTSRPSIIPQTPTRPAAPFANPQVHILYETPSRFSRQTHQYQEFGFPHVFRYPHRSGRPVGFRTIPRTENNMQLDNPFAIAYAFYIT